MPKPQIPADVYSAIACWLNSFAATKESHVIRAWLATVEPAYEPSSKEVGALWMAQELPPNEPNHQAVRRTLRRLDAAGWRLTRKGDE